MLPKFCGADSFAASHGSNLSLVAITSHVAPPEWSSSGLLGRSFDVWFGWLAAFAFYLYGAAL